jgi:hypothetical protein
MRDSTPAPDAKNDSVDEPEPAASVLKDLDVEDREAIEMIRGGRAGPCPGS